MPLRVLQLGSPTNLYGAERWILALIKHLDPSKVESIVAAVKDDPSLDVPLCKEARKLGFRTKIFEAYGRVNISAIKQVRDFVRQNNIHVIHTHGYKQDMIGLLATFGTPCKLVSTPHGWSKQVDFKLRCYEIMNRAIFPFFDAVVPLSDDLYAPLAESRWYSALSKFRKVMRPSSPNQRINQSTNSRIPDSTNLHLIKNGVDLSEIDSVAEANKEIVSWKEERYFVIGYVGRLIESKGIDVLLKAVCEINGVKCRIAIVGDGELMEQLVNLSHQLGIEDKVKFFGFRPDRVAFLKSFDLFVLPSRTEGTPRCLMEAMAAGLPVLVSDISGCKVLVEHGKTGLLFPVDEPKFLANGIKELASKESLRKSLGRAAREFIEEHFSAQRMAQEYESLYFSLAAQTNSTNQPINEYPNQRLNQ